VYFKLLKDDGTGVLLNYAKKNNGSFTGARVSIKRLLDGGHSNYKVADLAKILGKTIPAATAYQNEIKQAIKERRLFEIKVCPTLDYSV
jgi:hypothetical protein